MRAMIRSAWQDVRYTLRKLRNVPAFAITAVSVLALGLGTGGTMAWFAVSLAQSYIFGVKPHDVRTFAAVPLVLAAACMVAAWLPARRAASVDPILA